MRLIRRIMACGVLILAALFAMASLPAAKASPILYKNYVVLQDQGYDILCDTYIVQPNDYIYKLFRESGEISQADFGEFLNIFRRINPDIPDIDRIKSGLRILIPLKKISPESLPGQQTGIVSIPFMTISTLPELLKSNAAKHHLKKGDTVSGLLSRAFGKAGTKSHRTANQIFQILNPDVHSLDMVKTGQSVWIPDISVMNQPWYPSYFDGSGNLINREIFPFANNMTSPPPLPSAPVSSLEKAAKLLEAKIFNKGAYYFPRVGADDFELDLSRFPVLELSDQRRGLIVPPSSSSRSGISESDLTAITSFWKSVFTVAVDPDAPVEKIMEAFFYSKENRGSDNTVSFSDNGVRITVRARWWLNQPGKKNQNTPANDPKLGFVSSIDPEAGNTFILEYLAKHNIILKEIKDDEKETPRRAKTAILLPPVIPAAPPEALVTALMTVLALPFSPGVPISFPYGGIQIPAISNLISMGGDRSILVDFGNLYGEAIAAIEKSGLDVVHITPQETQHEMIRKLLAATRLSYETNPTFAGAKSPEAFGVEFSIPGFLVSKGEMTKVLLSRVFLDPSLIRFLNERGIGIAQIDE